MKKIAFVQFVFALAMMINAVTTLLAQSTSGVIHGTVLDPSGALVPSAQVTITNTTGFNQQIRSDATGNFEAPHLAPGSYSVSVNAPGFTPALAGGVKVSNSKVTNENIHLRISVDQEIEVSADDASTAAAPGITAQASGN